MPTLTESDIKKLTALVKAELNPDLSKELQAAANNDDSGDTANTIAALCEQKAFKIHAPSFYYKIAAQKKNKSGLDNLQRLAAENFEYAFLALASLYESGVDNFLQADVKQAIDYLYRLSILGVTDKGMYHLSRIVREKAAYAGDAYYAIALIWEDEYQQYQQDNCATTFPLGKMLDSFADAAQHGHVMALNKIELLAHNGKTAAKAKLSELADKGNTLAQDKLKQLTLVKTSQTLVISVAQHPNSLYGSSSSVSVAPAAAHENSGVRVTRRRSSL